MITEKTYGDITVKIGIKESAIILAKIALYNRLYVSGWEMSHTLQHIIRKENRDNECVSLVYHNGIPVSISIHEWCGRVQCFTRKAKRKQGFGRLAVNNVLEHSGNKIKYNEMGIKGSRDFFYKVLP